MKREIKLALSTAVIASLAIVGAAFCLNQSATNQSPAAAGSSRLVRRSVIKVHTDHGVVTLPGAAESWTEVEHAVFIADSIADFQFANSEVPWRTSNE
ncbi:MAG TPA: hypothetical protein VJX23_12130 [Candidatus Binataceae bacterium]|nr:hypothetical protein [Candidatus Binataceae bacterium]